MKVNKPPRRNPYIAFALIIVLGFVVYANSLNGQFILDDDYLIGNNRYIKDFSHLSKLFVENIGAGSDQLSNLYRPIQMLTYVADYSFWKLDTRGYHLTNILLHVMACLAIYWFVQILFSNTIISVSTSLLFLVHPIHTEAVSYISGRADPLVLLFMLISFIFYIRYLKQKNPSSYILMTLSYLLALLSKEMSLILPLLILLYHYAFKRRLDIKGFMPIIILTFIYSILRLTVLNFPLPPITSELPNAFQRLPGFFVAITGYIRLLLSPSDLHMEYGQRLFDLTHPQAIIGILIMSTSLIYAFKKRTTSPLIFFSISWFFICLLPVSHICFINAYMAEHWLYLPSIGFFLLLSNSIRCLYEIKKARPFIAISAILLLVSYSYLTIRQNGHWREPIPFYERTLEYAPDSLRLRLNLGNAYLNIGKDDEAIATYRKIIDIDPNHSEAHNNLGAVYSMKGKKEEAISLFKKAIELNPAYADAYLNLADTYSEIGSHQEAIDLYKKVIELRPFYAPAYVSLGIVYFNIGKGEEAIDLFKKAIAIDPNFAGGYYNLSVGYFKKGKYKLSIEYCDKAKELGYVSHNLLEALKPYRELGR